MEIELYEVGASLALVSGTALAGLYRNRVRRNYRGCNDIGSSVQYSGRVEPRAEPGTESHEALSEDDRELLEQ